MYQRKNLIYNVVAVDVKTHSYSYKNLEEYFVVINGMKEKKCDFPVSKIVSKGDYLYLWMDAITSCDVYEKFCYLKRLPDTYLLRIDNEMVIDKSYVDFNTFITFYNLVDPISEGLVLKEYIPYNLYVSGNLLLAYNNFRGEVKRIDKEMKQKWQFPLSILGNAPHEDKTDEIEKILGITHGNIWFNTKGGRLVALDVETGEISKRYSYYPHDSLLGYDTNLKIGKGAFLSEWDNQIYGMSGNYFQRINTVNFKIEEEFNYNSYPNGIGKFKNHYSFLLQGDYFTFLAQKDEDQSGIRYVGLFDYRKKELVWEYEVISIEERKNGNELVRSQPLYMSGDKLYIKDFKNTLHIFELDK